uniref:cysteine-rich receptor-like protein kinase 2 isoform X1 n=1 Tax=Erigeron canadensis TaxID=72917 RepID=UPI001CB892C8|nr:cysteine-rich receptor-like protein kinase 2 isoform X1 [Erigeron canadensis]
MGKPIHTLVICIALIIILSLVSRSEGDARAQTVKMICDEGENNQTILLQNIIRVYGRLSNQMQTSHNATASVETSPNQVFGLSQCYGDLSMQDCQFCFAQIRNMLPSCYPEIGGRLYYDGCFGRVQTYNFFQQYTGPDDTIICGNTTTKSTMFQNSTRQAVMNAATDALRNSDYFAREEVTRIGYNDSVYVLAQCWNTLSPESCRACLMNASASITRCLPWSEGRALNAGCFMRYSDTDFLNPIPTTRSSRNKGKRIAIVVSVVSSVAVFTVALVIILYIRKRQYIQQRRNGSYEAKNAKKLVKILTDSNLNFKYSTIEKATGNWDDSNKLGQGGFGTVYKGVLLDGREIAVKRLFLNNKFRAADFYNEVNIINSVQHKNLVRLLGCSCSGPESILIYEYLPNMSLDRYIFDEIKGKELKWEKRFEIIIGIAEGLVYLHENTKRCIIHRDIKASNILLDLRLRPKIADFGLARSFQGDKSHMSTAIVGTLGYIAPEYLARGQLTEKADVYSFGVLLLELVSGMESNRSKTMEYSEFLVSIAWRHFNEGTVKEMFDPNLMMNVYPNIIFQKDAIRVIHVGLLCIQEAPSLRPSMSAALRMLAKDHEPLPIPSSPPFIDKETMELNITQTLQGISVATASLSYFHPR